MDVGSAMKVRFACLSTTSTMFQFASIEIIGARTLDSQHYQNKPRKIEVMLQPYHKIQLPLGSRQTPAFSESGHFLEPESVRHCTLLDDGDNRTKPSVFQSSKMNAVCQIKALGLHQGEILLHSRN